MSFKTMAIIVLVVADYTPLQALPHNLALVYPRPITFIGKIPAEFEWTKSLYGKLGQEDRVRVVRSAQEWTPYR